MKKKKIAKKAGAVVEGEILPTMEIDCSTWIGDVPLEKWTCGPVLPVNGEVRRTKNGERDAKGRKKGN